MNYKSKFTGQQIDQGIDKANSAYQKPQTGIPASDLSEDVQSSVKQAQEAVKAAQQASTNAEDAVTKANNAVSDANNALQSITTMEGNVSTAEQERKDAETARQTAETARDKAEADRGKTEQGRKDAESERVAAEQGRKDAESERGTAEQGRKDAESERVTAEQGREKEMSEYMLVIKKPIISTSEKAVIMDANKFYAITIGTILILDINPPQDTAITNDWEGCFDTGSSAPTVMWPANVNWGTSYMTLAINTHYEFSIRQSDGKLYGILYGWSLD